ncbi:MAG: hypothetical protein H6740_27335 [Alphaproteobacteria bacterium]|nr:hypothetical protein [Alphaproteobacteria bacterium]
MFLVGSLIRRLGSTPERLEIDRKRERAMWTRMKRWLVEHEVAPADAMWICGAAHSATDVPEFGTATLGQPEDPLWDIPEPTPTEWLYGFIPSAYSAIEHQFGHPRGTISLAQASWDKAKKALDLETWALSKKRKKGKKPPTPTDSHLESHGDLLKALTRAPALKDQDTEQLLGWCTGVVDLARKNGYLASTADAISIYETSVLLAGMRGRRHPSSWDFTEAAITCLEKTRVPGKRSVHRICEMMLGGDRVGHVGYSSAPPLLQDLYDRLAPLGVKPKKSSITRALMNFRTDPHLRALSDLLWQVHYLLPGSKAARVIMGERRLGEEPAQESWDILLYGEGQRDVIQLAFEGVTVEQVLELRLKKKAMADGAKTVEALAVVEDAILYLRSDKLVGQIGARAVQLLPLELGADHAQEIFERARRLVHHFRAQATGLPDWLRNFVATGYQHYATQLPKAFEDRGTNPQQLAGMLSFVFTLESLALSMGCKRSQLLIAVRQAGPLTTDPDKIGLLWAAEWLLELRSTPEVRAEFNAIITNPMRLPALPATLGGFLLALSFTPLVGQLAVELLSRAFLELPDALLIPWLPGLISSLKPHTADLAPALLKEAAQSMPGTPAGLDAWVPPWEVYEEEAAPELAAGPELSATEAAARALLFAHRASPDAHAAALGQSGAWVELSAAPAVAAGPSLAPEEAAARALLFAHRASPDAHAAAIGAAGDWVEIAEAPVAAASAKAGGPVPGLLAEHPAALETWAARVG